MAPPDYYASASGSACYHHYDVFLSHRGPDLKNTFASHLYRSLRSRGLQVFLDKGEMVEGHPITSQIEAAIQVASVQIAIFSPTYAKSRWCLEELVRMIDSRSTILPIFYKVEPSEVRCRDQTGVYGKALREHEEKGRYDSHTIVKWKEALKHVASISGFELKNYNGDEGELLDEVVQRVWKIFEKERFIYVTEHPTGLEEKSQELERTVLLRHHGDHGCRVVGIVGPGGMGKTTLAKHFFNSKKSYYDHSCFLSDIRESAGKGSLNKLQRTLLKSFTQLDLPIASIGEGIEQLIKCLRSSHALLVLDDVDDAGQLDAFLPLKDVLGSNSLILVTSRDKNVLKVARILEKSIYKLTGLDRPQSQKLFCWYAFLRPDPLPGFEDLVDRVLTACGGLPLSLKVLGALLYEEDNMSYWEERLKILPREIVDRLTISYDSLSLRERQIFLDIACFFIGEDINTAKRLWGSVEVRNIENKCLFEVDRENKIKMHDQIRDMGRSIAEGLIPRRLWRPTKMDIENLLKLSSSEINEVLGIRMVPRDNFAVMSSEISEMSQKEIRRDEASLNRKSSLSNNDSNLQLLATEDGCLKRIFSRVRSPHLIWLCWSKCPYSSLPSWIPMDNLRVLEVAGSRLNVLWPHESQGPLLLRELNIRAPISKFPKSIGQLKHIEKIVVNYSSFGTLTFQTLPDEFCHLSSLKYLQLKPCSSMMLLPDSFGNLTNLQHLDLSCASSLQMLPNSFGNLTRLKHLDLSDCSNLVFSNGIFGNISTLQCLILTNCHSVNELPPLTRQIFLEYLDLSGTNLKELPRGLEVLSNLEAISLSGLEALPTLLGHLKGLRYLWLSDCPKLKNLPVEISQLKQLTVLEIRKCGIHYLPENLRRMNNLNMLNVSDCPLRQLPFGWRWGRALRNDNFMCGLTFLTLTNIELMEVSFSKGSCPNLQHLYIASCKYVEEVERLPSTLTSLKVVGCEKLKVIQGLAQLTRLRMLYVDQCHELRELPDVQQLMSLQNLTISGCRKLQAAREVLDQLGQRLKEGLSWTKED